MVFVGGLKKTKSVGLNRFDKGFLELKICTEIIQDNQITSLGTNKFVKLSTDLHF